MKKAGLVLSSTAALVCAALAPGALGSDATAGAARAVGPAVKVEVKTLTKTLLPPTTVHGRTGWITTGGTPSGKCSARSAAGALDAATHSRWGGKYYSGVGIFVSSILGVKPPGSEYWAIYANGHYENLGICDIKLHAGDQLLFKIHK